MPCNCSPFAFPLKCQRNSCPLKSCRPIAFNSIEELEQFRASGCSSKGVIELDNLTDKPPIDDQTITPSVRRKAWNLIQSLAAFVSDGLKLVTQSQYKDRLEICDQCPHRSNTRCLKCGGCKLSLKARGRAFTCPDNRWPKLT